MRRMKLSGTLLGSTPHNLSPTLRKVAHDAWPSETAIAVINFTWGVPLDAKVLSAFAHACGFQIWWKISILKPGKYEKTFN